MYLIQWAKPYSSLGILSCVALSSAVAAASSLTFTTGGQSVWNTQTIWAPSLTLSVTAHTAGGSNQSGCFYIDGARKANWSASTYPTKALSVVTTAGYHNIELAQYTGTTCPATKTVGSSTGFSDYSWIANSVQAPTPAPTYNKYCSDSSFTNGVCLDTTLSACPNQSGTVADASWHVRIQSYNNYDFTPQTACVYQFLPASTCSVYKGDIIGFTGGKGNAFMASLVTGTGNSISDCFRVENVVFDLVTDQAGVYGTSMGWEYSGGDVNNSDLGGNLRNNMKSASKKPAYLMEYVYNNIFALNGAPGQNPGTNHAGTALTAPSRGVGTGAGFCAQGGSGGSSAVLYGLIHNGGDQILDHVQLKAATPFVRLDNACLSTAANLDPSNGQPAFTKSFDGTSSYSGHRGPVTSTNTTIEATASLGCNTAPGLTTGVQDSSLYCPGSTTAHPGEMFLVASSTNSIGGTSANPTTGGNCGANTGGENETWNYNLQSIASMDKFNTWPNYVTAANNIIKYPNTSISAFLCGGSVSTNLTQAGARHLFGPEADLNTTSPIRSDGTDRALLGTGVAYYDIRTCQNSGGCSTIAPQLVNHTTPCDSVNGCAPMVAGYSGCANAEDQSLAEYVIDVEKDLAYNCVQHH